MSVIIEALMKVGVEIALKHAISLVRKYPASILMGILSAARYFR